METRRKEYGHVNCHHTVEENVKFVDVVKELEKLNNEKLSWLRRIDRLEEQVGYLNQRVNPYRNIRGD